MQAKTLARVGAITFVAVAITATALQMRNRPPQDPAAAAALPDANRDPLRAELARCQSLGQDGANDAACLRAWDENRRRFFGLSGRRTATTPDERAAPVPAAPLEDGANGDPVAKASAPAPAGGR